MENSAPALLRGRDLDLTGRFHRRDGQNAVCIDLGFWRVAAGDAPSDLVGLAEILHGCGELRGCTGLHGAALGADRNIQAVIDIDLLGGIARIVFKPDVNAVGRAADGSKNCMVVCHASTNAARDLDGLPAFAVCDDLIADDMPVGAHRLCQAAVGAVSDEAKKPSRPGVNCGPDRVHRASLPGAVRGRHAWYPAWHHAACAGRRGALPGGRNACA